MAIENPTALPMTGTSHMGTTLSPGTMETRTNVAAIANVTQAVSSRQSVSCAHTHRSSLTS